MAPRTTHWFQERPWDGPTKGLAWNTAAAERTWHIQDSQGQMLSLTFRHRPVKCVEVFQFRSEAEPHRRVIRCAVHFDHFIILPWPSFFTLTVLFLQLWGYSLCLGLLDLVWCELNRTVEETWPLPLDSTTPLRKLCQNGARDVGVRVGVVTVWIMKLNPLAERNFLQNRSEKSSRGMFSSIFPNEKGRLSLPIWTCTPPSRNETWEWNKG